MSASVLAASSPTDDITSPLPEGAIVGLIGPNGSGKTTLFNSIVGSHPIDSGSIRFDGQEISTLRVAEIARLGLLRTFQQTRIYRRMSCLDNMLISAPRRATAALAPCSARLGAAEDRERAEELLEFVRPRTPSATCSPATSPSASRSCSSSPWR